MHSALFDPSGVFLTWLLCSVWKDHSLTHEQGAPGGGVGGGCQPFQEGSESEILFLTGMGSHKY